MTGDKGDQDKQSLADFAIDELGIEEISPEEYENEAGRTRSTYSVMPEDDAGD